MKVWGEKDKKEARPHSDMERHCPSVIPSFLKQYIYSFSTYYMPWDRDTTAKGTDLPPLLGFLEFSGKAGVKQIITPNTSVISAGPHAMEKKHQAL